MAGDNKRAHVPKGTKGDGISTVSADAILIENQLRAVDRGWVLALAHVMLHEGQREPVQLLADGRTGKFMLIHGAHRVAAAKRFSGLSPLTAELITGDGARWQIEKRLTRLRAATLTVFEKCALIGELWSFLNAFSREKVGLCSVEGGDRIADIAALTGFAYDQSRLYIGLHRALAARVVEMLRDRPISEDIGQMRALADRDWAMQEKIAYLLLSGVDSVSEAVSALRGNTRSISCLPTESLRAENFLDMFERMSLAEKHHVLSRLDGLLPPGISISGIE